MAKPGEGEGSFGRREKAGVRKQNRKTDGDWTPGGLLQIKTILLKMQDNFTKIIKMIIKSINIIING